MAHNDDAPVKFRYSAMNNISFRGTEDSGYTWGEWREMSEDEKREAFQEFLWGTLGVDVSEVEE
jgi:hypothetical protein